MKCWVTITTAADCQNDYTPCNCSYNEAGNSNRITCGGSMADVATAFQSKPALDIDSLTLNILPAGDSIPADLLGQSRIIGSLSIGGVGILRVDPNAFRASKNLSLSFVSFRDLDTSRMDFDFLIDFPNIVSMAFSYVLSLERSLPTLPSLPALISLYFQYSSDLNKAFSYSVLKCNGLKDIYFDQRKL